MIVDLMLSQRRKSRPFATLGEKQARNRGDLVEFCGV